MDSRIRQIDNPNKPGFCFDKLLKNLCRFHGKVIIQTMFLRGEKDGVKVDNTTEEEITGWLDALKKINPNQVMIYTIDRETPLKTLYKVSKEMLLPNVPGKWDSRFRFLIDRLTGGIVDG